MGIQGEEGIPPPPSPRNALTGAGFAKERPQNLDSKELGGQNLDNKGVKAHSDVSDYTASACVMICFHACGWQG